MSATPLISAIRFLRQKGIEFQALIDGVLFNVQINDEKSLSIIILDISERAAPAAGFKILIPDIAEFPAGVDAARMVNRLNSRDGVIGKFMVAEDMSLRFALETVFPKDGGDGPEHVGAALNCAMDSVMGFYAIAEKAANGGAPSDAR